MRKLVPFAVLALVAAGCSSGDGDSGDVATAQKASEAAPKSVDQLPANMTPEQRAVAEAGMGSQQAMKAQMDRQAAAMNAARAGAR